VAGGLLGMFMLGIFTVRGDGRAVVAGILFAVTFSAVVSFAGLGWLPQEWGFFIGRHFEGYYTGIVGNVVVWLIVDEAHVATLAVAPDYRGQGVARALLAAVLLEAWRRGARKSLLEVRRSNTAALHLYYGLGFAAVGLRPGYYEDTHEDALLLTLENIQPQALEKLLKSAEIVFEPGLG